MLLSCNSTCTYDASLFVRYSENNTWARVDMEFIFECSTRYLRRERSERMRFGVENEKRNSISTSNLEEIINFYTTFSCSHLLFVYHSYGHNRPLLTRKVDFTNERKSRVHNPRKKGRKVHRQ